MSDISTKPYLLRAIHEWCSDSGYTPYIAVSVDEHTLVPDEFVRAGEIVLNVSMSATNRLSIGNELIEFQARFGGVARELSIPIENVSAIYARENGHGMAFEVPKALAIAEASDEQSDASDEQEPTELVAQDEPAVVETEDADEPAPTDDDAPKPKKARSTRKKARPTLAAVPKSVEEPNTDEPDPDPESDSGEEAAPAKSSKSGGPRKRRGKPKLTRVK